jgi:hypothetical protein
MLTIAFFDTKPYDPEDFERAESVKQLQIFRGFDDARVLAFEGLFFKDLSGEVLQDDELSQLLTFPDVLVTAHHAFLTREALSEIARVTTANLLRFKLKCL